MYNFFISESNVSEKETRIVNDDYNHIKNVLRMREGDELIVSFNGNSHLCKIKAFLNDEVIAEIIEKNYLQTNLPVKVYLFQGLPKSDKLELIIQKAVELGVDEIIPVENKRSVVKIEEKKADAKVSRWQSIAESAAKQSKRNVVPTVKKPMPFNKALSVASNFDLVIIPYENKDGMQSTINAFKSLKRGMSIAVFIGPEGGYDDDEIKAAIDSGAIPVSLGKRILRTETAAITSLSAIMLYAECIL